MISKAQIQFIRSLEQKRSREESGCFLVEGDKMVREALELPIRGPFRIKAIYGLSKWLDSNLADRGNPDIEMIPVSERELERISLLKTPNQVLAIIARDLLYSPDFDFGKDLLIGLDKIQDPGNVGTIIRLADWFGLGGVIASPDSADFFSPKVVQSSMGSVFRVKLTIADISEFMQDLPPGFPVYGTHLEGENLYEADIEAKGLILMGNESKGLDADLTGRATSLLRIPDFSDGPVKPESLNVSVAAAIICSEFRRRGIC
jgi:TrmH family RNA methyltransferase